MATEYKLNYTASEINQKLATVDETKNTLENSYYNSLEIDGMLEQADSEVEASLATKADLVDGKVPIEQLPDDIGGGVSEWNDIQNKPGDTVITSLDVSYDWSSYDNIDNQDNYRALMYMGCNVSTPRTINVSLKNKTTEDIAEFGSCELSSVDLGGMELIQCSINTTTSMDGLMMGTETSLTKIDSSLHAVAIAFVPAQSMTMFATDIIDYTNYELIISCEDTTSIKLSNSSLNLDEEPIEGSENYVNSGAVYTAFRDVYDFVNEQVGGSVVNSVNGKTGDVVLTAFDVGALPNTTEIPVIPTDISVFNNDVNYMTEGNVENRLVEFSKYFITEDELEQELNEKQDNLIFDSVPQENSLNPITSRGVYNALKNISVGGGVSEWEDIQDKPGDVAGEIITKEHIVNIENIQNFSYEEDAGCYIFQNGDVFCEENLSGKEIKVSIRRPNDSEPTICDASLIIPNEEYPEEAFIFFNTTTNDIEEWLGGGFPKANETLPTFICLTMGYIYASEDLTGYGIEIYTENIKTDYIKLSYEYISNKPGDTVTTTVEKDIFNIKNAQFQYEESENLYYAVGEYPSEEIYDSRSNIIGKEVKISICSPNDSEPTIHMEEAFAMYEGEPDMLVYFNTVRNFEECLSSGIPKNDQTKPSFIVVFVDGVAAYASEDLSGYDIRVFFEDVATYTVKLPNEALNFDSEPTENSENLVTSGEIYNLVNDINTAISQLNNVAQCTDYIDKGIINLSKHFITSESFLNNQDLSTIMIIPGVKGVENSAFEDCTNLTSITIPDSVTSFGARAFKGCTKLDNVIIPNGVEYIAINTFEDCRRLKNIVLPESLTTIASRAFANTALYNLSIPKNVTAIGEEAFSGCRTLYKLILPRTESVVSLSNANALDGTPISSNETGASIYVPNELLSEYESAQGWSSYASVIQSIDNLE